MMVGIRGNILITTTITTITIPSVYPIITEAKGANECYDILWNMDVVAMLERPIFSLNVTLVEAIPLLAAIKRIL